MATRFPLRLLVLIFAFGSAFGASPAGAAKNVIVMISDGAGYNTWLAASMYRGRVGHEVYDGRAWVKLGCTTYPLNTSSVPTGSNQQDARWVYRPEAYWDTAPQAVVDAGSGAFAGYNYAKQGYTDSAAAGTAIASGVKTYNKAVNWTDDDRPLVGKTIAERCKALAKSCGVITTVEWSHATPATLGAAHNRRRDNYAEIANEMLRANTLDVIMGAGHPDFDDNGRPRDVPVERRDYSFVGGQDTWGKLTAAWTLIQTKDQFERLAQGPTPRRVLGTAQVATTLQFQRSRGRAPLPGSTQEPAPFARPLNANVSTLASMAQGALNCLDDNPAGFFLMIEGGAVDWANHANDKGRMIEEQVDFVAAVEAVCEWVEKNSSWDETLLILTADHEAGMLWGPQSDVEPFQPIEDRGPGKLPGMMYHSNQHTQTLAPLWARGRGSEALLSLVRGHDAKAGSLWGFSGDYVDNTDIFSVMQKAIENP